MCVSDGVNLLRSIRADSLKYQLDLSASLSLPSALVGLVSELIPCRPHARGMPGLDIRTHLPSTFSRSDVMAWARILSPRKTAVWLSADMVYAVDFG